MVLSVFSILAIAGAAVAAGLINALAGGGTLIAFPILTLLGVPPVVANVTLTVALSPGYLGGALAQRQLLAGQKKRLLALVPVSVVGGIAGGFLLLHTSEQLFRSVVPYLILLAAGLLAVQGPVRKLLGRAEGHGASNAGPVTLLCIAAAGVYAGYFGAGVSIVTLAILGLTINESLTRLNAVKQALSFAMNIAAALFFVFSGKVDWTVAAIMAVGALAGGMLGGRLANRISPTVLRVVVVAFGTVIGLYFLFRP